MSTREASQAIGSGGVALPAALVRAVPRVQNQVSMPFGDRAEHTAASEAWQYGPCLYLGSQGQRCDRPALENGFCAQHSPDRAATRATRLATQVAAFLLILGLLWPLLHDFLREISRWIKK